MTDGRLRTVTAGTYRFQMQCPDCGDTVDTLAELSEVLTITSADGGALRPKLKAKKVDHSCAAPAETPLFDAE